MNELNIKRSCRSGVLSLLALLGVSPVITEEAAAKLAVTRKVTSTTVMPKRLGGGTSSSKENGYALYCQGYPVLIKEVEGKTQVYVKDDDGNDPIDSEMYRIEGVDDWSNGSIYAGGEIVTSGRTSVSVTMTGGEVYEIILAGNNMSNQVTDDASLSISGGNVCKISIMGPGDSGVNGTVNIALSNMTYGYSKPISNIKCIDDEDSNGWPIFNTDNVTITYDNCSFDYPFANPNHVSPTDDPNVFDTNCSGNVAGTVAGHEYYIAKIEPDRDFVDAGAATIKCKHCDKEWVITFGAYGGYASAKDATAYSYYVELASTLVPPTCVPGRGIYRLVLKVNQTEITGEYESEIPPVDDVHNWGDDGICHEDHYETVTNADGSVSHDEFGNIKYKLLNGDLIKKILSESERTLSRSYVRVSRKDEYFAGSSFSKLKRVNWDLYNFDTPLSALTIGMISGDNFQKDVVIGLNQDVVLYGDLDSEPIAGTAVLNDSARFINLHGHVLDADSHKLGVSGALTIMNGEVKNAEIVGRANAALTLDNATLTSNKITWAGTRGVLLRNGSVMSLSNEISSNSVQMDGESIAVAKDGEEYTSNVETSVSSLKYTREFTHTNWQSLFVPFGIKVTSDILADCDIAAIKQMNFGDNTSLVIEKLEAGTTTEAGKPYFIRPKSVGEFSFEQTETILKPASYKTNIPFNSVDESLCFTFEGSYTANYQPTITPSASWYALNNEGTLQKASATSKIKNPGRWYVVRNANNLEKASSRMSILVFGEENIIESQFILEDYDSNIYTPTGISVGKNRSALSAGIYVSGGKVFVVQ